MNKLLENTHVRFATLMTAIAMVVGFAWSESHWRTNIARDIKEIRELLERDAVTQGQFSDWVIEFKARNPNVQVPPLKGGRNTR